MKREKLEKLFIAYGELEFLLGQIIGYSWCERNTKIRKRKIKAVIHGCIKLKNQFLTAMKEKECNHEEGIVNVKLDDVIDWAKKMQDEIYQKQGSKLSDSYDDAIEDSVNIVGKYIKKLKEL